MMKVFHLSTDKKKLDNLLANRDRKRVEQIPLVREICEEVRKNGDKALLRYTEKFDKVSLKGPSELRIKKRQVKGAYQKVDEEFVNALQLAKTNIEKFHTRQKNGRESWHEEREGAIVGEKYSALERVGVYAPGGEAPYPSTVLMDIIPGKIAGVAETIVATPDVNPHVLVAADLAGADQIFRVGGAQAIAAMAFGTETIPKVDKIIGPGNIYVAMAKLIVQQETSVGIDMVAGPTEIMILADGKGRVDFAVADMLAQAEHGMSPLVILATTSEEFAKAIPAEAKKQMKKLKRAGIIEEALREDAIIILVNDIDEAIDLANDIAPEHLELQVARPWECMEKIKNAGAVFIGDYTPESLGDYLAGPNHVLPTGGRAKFSSPLGVDDFLKKTNFIFSDRTHLRNSAKAVTRLAESEGFDAHAEAVRIRLKKSPMSKAQKKRGKNK